MRVIERLPKLTAAQKEKQTRAILEILSIPYEDWENIQRIAQLVGGDWGMEVEIGMPGEGSHFNPDENRIQLDPLHLADPERLRQAEFVAAHEGGHRAISRSPLVLGMTEEKIEELYSQLGFAFGDNSLEDPADNNWWSKKYEGLGETVQGIYDKMLEKDGAVLASAEVNELITQLGYPPRFALFGSELIRYWHQHRFSENLPAEVHAALERVKEAADRYYATIPGRHPTEKEVRAAAQKRLTIFHDKIWPEMKKLIELDKRDEELRQAVIQNELKLEDWLKEILDRIMQETGKRTAGQIEEESKKTAAQLRRDAQALREAAKKYESGS